MTFERRFHCRLIFPDIVKKALHLIKLSPFHIICIQNAVTELLCALSAAAEAEIHHRLTAVSHPLV